MTYQRILIIAVLAILSRFDSLAQAQLGKKEVGKASYYSSRFHGRKTSLGEIHKSTDLTAAHRTLPFNTMLEVTNVETQQKVIVRVNDRGPYSKSRLIDVSKEAARQLGLISLGVASVSIRVVGMEGMVLLDEGEDVDSASGKIISLKSDD
jgi:rare lipoprotein A